MRRILRLLAAVLLLLLALAPTAFADDLSVEDFFERSFEASNLPGMIAMATDGGEIVLARGDGVDGQGEPMTPITLVRVAGMTKTVTSVAVHQLADDGRIALDDPIVKHLPEFSLDDPRHTSITIQQLLDNRSGMRDGQFDLGRLNRSSSLQDYVANMQGATLASDPGAAQAYSNPNWEVLARMVEVVSGQAYDDYLQAHVFRPLGMQNSTVDITKVDPPGGHQELFGFHFPRRDTVLFSHSSGSNGLITTADDLARWTRWVASGEGGDILAPATRTAMIDRAQQEGSTDGFEGRGERIGKSGMQHTELSQLRISPELGLGVTVVVNDGDMSGPAFALADGALDVMDGTPIEPVGGDWWKKTAAYVTVTLLGLVLTVVGVRRARRWAEHRRTGRRWVTALRLAWLVLPALLLISLPWLARVLTMGVRTILWTQLSYLVSRRSSCWPCWPSEGWSSWWLAWWR